MSLAALSLIAVSKDFGRIIALRNIDLEVPAGEFLSILGRNGAGKTTLLNIISGVSRPSPGTVTLFGEDPRLEANRGRLAVISHEMFLYGGLTAYENLDYYARIYRVSDRADRIRTALETVALSQRRFDLVATFSRGMMQRLTIARALLHEPSLLLLDEPFTGLDQQAVGMLIAILKEQQAQQRTILLTTHDLHTAHELSDRYIVLEKHRIIQDESMQQTTPETLRSRYFSAMEGSA